MPQKLNGRQKQCTFLLLDVPPFCIQMCKYLLNMVTVLRCGLAISQNVIHIHKNTLVQQVCEQQIHAALEMCRCVLKTKRHDIKFKRSITTRECRLETIRFFDWNLMIAIPQVKFAEVLCTTQPCQHFIDPRQRPRISDGVAIQRTIVNAHAQTTTTFLFRKKNGCTIRATAWYNSTRLKQLMHLLPQFLQLKRRQRIQLALSWLHRLINQRYGKWSSVLSNWKFRLSKHTGVFLFQFGKQLGRAFKAMLNFASMCSPMRDIQSTNLLNSCQKHNLGLGLLNELGRRDQLPRAVSFKHDNTFRQQIWLQFSQRIACNTRSCPAMLADTTNMLAIVRCS